MVARHGKMVNVLSAHHTISLMIIRYAVKLLPNAKSLIEPLASVKSVILAFKFIMGSVSSLKSLNLLIEAANLLNQESVANVLRDGILMIIMSVNLLMTIAESGKKMAHALDAIMAII